MGLNRRVFLGLAGWGVCISGLHLGLNFDWEEWKNARLPPDQRKLEVGYLPVT